MTSLVPWSCSTVAPAVESSLEVVAEIDCVSVTFCRHFIHVKQLNRPCLLLVRPLFLPERPEGDRIEK